MGVCASVPTQHTAFVKLWENYFRFCLKETLKVLQFVTQLTSTYPNIAERWGNTFSFLSPFKKAIMNQNNQLFAIFRAYFTRDVESSKDVLSKLIQDCIQAYHLLGVELISEFTETLIVASCSHYIRASEAYYAKTKALSGNRKNTPANANRKGFSQTSINSTSQQKTQKRPNGTNGANGNASRQNSFPMTQKKGSFSPTTTSRSIGSYADAEPSSNRKRLSNSTLVKSRGLTPLSTLEPENQDFIRSIDTAGIPSNHFWSQKAASEGNNSAQQPTSGNLQFIVDAIGAHQPSDPLTNKIQVNLPIENSSFFFPQTPPPPRSQTQPNSSAQVTNNNAKGSASAYPTVLVTKTMNVVQQIMENILLLEYIALENFEQECQTAIQQRELLAEYFLHCLPPKDSTRADSRMYHQSLSTFICLVLDPLTNALGMKQLSFGDVKQTIQQFYN